MKCKRETCHKEAAPLQAYCTRDCSPYGWLGLDRYSEEGIEKNARGSVNQKKRKNHNPPKPRGEDGRKRSQTFYRDATGEHPAPAWLENWRKLQKSLE